MKGFIAQHLAALYGAFRRLVAAPLSTILSLLVIGTALALPSAGWVVLDNSSTIAGNASGVQQISLFMTLDADKKDVAEIKSRLRDAALGEWRFVAKDEALQHLKSSEGMAEIIESLPKNPLPDAFVVEPANTEPESLEGLAKTFSAWPKVAHVQLDSAWIKRLNAFLQIGKLSVVMLAGLFAGALVVVGPLRHAQFWDHYLEHVRGLVNRNRTVGAGPAHDQLGVVLCSYSQSAIGV